LHLVGLAFICLFIYLFSILTGWSK